MRLLAVVPTSESSGAERVLLRYLKHARKHGHEVRCLVPNGRFAADLRADNIATTQMAPLTLPGKCQAVSLALLVRRWLSAARLIRSAATYADVILVNGFLALPAVRLAHVRAPVGWLVHDVVRKPEWRAVLRVCASAVHTAFPVSRAAAAPLLSYGIRVHVVRNGTTWPVAPAAPAPGVPIVGVNAVLTSWKGQDVLLDAVASLDIPVRVELMGGWFPRDREYARSLMRRAAEPDLAGRVEILGHVEDPLDRMRTWTVAVSSSVEPEAAPLNVLEAMSIGLPMVATSHGGTPEVLGDAGVLVPARDVSAMAAAIRCLLTNASLRHRCSVAGPAVIEAGLRLEDAAIAFVEGLCALTLSIKEHQA